MPGGHEVMLNTEDIIVIDLYMTEDPKPISVFSNRATLDAKRAVQPIRWWKP